MNTRKVAVIILYNDDGEILLQHRTKDAPVLPDYWAFFGGGIEEGETPEEAVKRECLEELSYELTKPYFLSVERVVYADRFLVVHVFLEKYNGLPVILGEGQGMGWYSTDATKDLLLVTDHDRTIIKTIEGLIDGRVLDG